jgi:hypothetical protein
MSTTANGSPPAPFATSPESMATGRDARSASAVGNPCISFACRAAQMRAALLARVTNDDMAAIADQLVVRASEGNMSAIKLLFRYILQEPAPVKQPLPLPQPAPMQRSAPAAERLSAEALAEALHRLELGLIWRSLRSAWPAAWPRRRHRHQTENRTSIRDVR